MKISKKILIFDSETFFGFFSHVHVAIVAKNVVFVENRVFETTSGEIENNCIFENKHVFWKVYGK